MLPYPQIDPVIFGLGPLKVRWYGLMYVLGFLAVHFIGLYQIKKFRLNFLSEHFENLNFILIIGLIVGARLGYVAIYNPAYYLQHPGEALAIWQGGMSFHGSLVGLVIFGWLYCLKNRLPFLKTADVYAVTAPVGLGLGRLGNFINGELFGRVTDSPLGMIFPNGGPLPRHPSQLYECALEGLLLFFILWFLKDISYRRKWPGGSLMATFLVFYGIFRSFAELFREPDAQIGFLLGSITMGQLLSGLMILAGAAIVFFNRNSSSS